MKLSKNRGYISCSNFLRQRRNKYVKQTRIKQIKNNVKLNKGKKKYTGATTKSENGGAIAVGFENKLRIFIRSCDTEKGLVPSKNCISSRLFGKGPPQGNNLSL